MLFTCSHFVILKHSVLLWTGILYLCDVAMRKLSSSIKVPGLNFCMPDDADSALGDEIYGIRGITLNLALIFRFESSLTQKPTCVCICVVICACVHSCCMLMLVSVCSITPFYLSYLLVFRYKLAYYALYIMD